MNITKTNHYRLERKLNKPKAILNKRVHINSLFEKGKSQ